MNKTPAVRFIGFAEDWEQRKLGEVSESYSGGTPSVGVKEYYGGQIPFIRSAEINSEITELSLTEGGLKNSSARLVDVGDILYALYGATSGEVGRARLKGAINQAILAIKPHAGYDSEYLAQWLRKSKHSIIETYLQGGQGNLSGTIVKELSVDFPLLKEQQTIGNFFSQLDHLITFHQRKYEKLKNIKKSMLEKMFPKNGSNVPEIRFKRFTDAWEQRKFGDIVQTRRGLTYKPTDIEESGIRVLRSSNIDEDTFVYGVDDVFVNPYAVNIEPVRKNDILITSANGSSRLVGKHALIKKISDGSAVHGGFMLLGRTKNYDFVNASMSSSWYTKFINVFAAGGNGAIGNLNKNDLDEQVILIPDDAEQIKIGEYFAALDNLITLHHRKLKKLEQIKQAMLHKMFM